MHRITLTPYLLFLVLLGCPEVAPLESENKETLENEITTAVCGDGEVTGDEFCDDGNDIDEDACTNVCTLATCGDGVTRTDIIEGEEGYEECDDGDDKNDDACTPHLRRSRVWRWYFKN